MPICPSEGDHKVAVTAADTVPDYLSFKVVPGANILTTVVDLGGGNLALSVAANVPPGASDHKVLVNGADTTAEFLGVKIVAGAAIALAVLNPAANEQIEISVSGLTNAQVAPAAAIDVSKLAAGANDTFLGTVAGVPTWTTIGAAGITPGAANTALVTNGAGTAVSWAKIVDANVDAAAAIAVSKLAAGSNGQVITTVAGVPTWSTVPTTGITPGAANTVLVTNGAGTATAWSTLVDANVDASAAIAGTKISPNFGSQNVQTTGGFLANSSAAFLRLGLAPGSGAGVASAASVGNIRVARGSPGFELYGRNNADTADTRLIIWDSASTILTFGSSSGVSDVRVQTTTTTGQVSILIGATSVLVVSLNQMLLAGSTFAFGSTVASPTINQAANNTANATGQKLLVQAQRVTNTGTIVGGELETAGGDSSGVSTNSTGGKRTSRAGDASNGNTLNQGGHHLIRAGRGTGTGAHDGNLAVHADPASWNSMERGIFFGDCVVRPTSAPVSGSYFATYTGRLLAYGSGGARQQISSTGPDSTKLYQQHVAPHISRVATSGAVTATGSSYDLSSATESLGIFNGVGIVAIAECQGVTAAGDYIRLIRLSSFTRIGGTATQKDVVTLGTDYTDAALVGAAATIDLNTDTIRVRVTGVAAQDIIWTVRLWLSGTES